jgi:hypothetical protein
MTAGVSLAGPSVQTILARGREGRAAAWESGGVARERAGRVADGVPLGGVGNTRGKVNAHSDGRHGPGQNCHILGSHLNDPDADSSYP